MNISTLVPFLVATRPINSVDRNIPARLTGQMQTIDTVWSVAQERASRNTPAGLSKTNVFLASPGESASSFPIYVGRAPVQGSAGAILTGLYVTERFFAEFPMAVQIGLVWGMSNAVLEQGYRSGEPYEGTQATQTYGQNCLGTRTADPSWTIAKELGAPIADETKRAWEAFLAASNLSIPGEVSQPSSRNFSLDHLPTYEQAISRTNRVGSDP